MALSEDELKDIEGKVRDYRQQLVDDTIYGARKIDGKYVDPILAHLLTQEELLSMPVRYLELSVRGEGVLRRAGLRTVGDVVGLTRETYSSLRQCGEKTVNEMEAVLAELGLSFRPATPE